MPGPDQSRTRDALLHSRAMVDHQIATWREWWSELRELGAPNFGEMGARLGQLRDILERHFELEEQLAKAARPLDTTAGVATRLEHWLSQPSGLLATLDEMIGRLESCEPAFACWGAAREEFEEFVERLYDHETEQADIEQLLSR